MLLKMADKDPNVVREEFNRLSYRSSELFNSLRYVKYDFIYKESLFLTFLNSKKIRKEVLLPSRTFKIFLANNPHKFF